MVVESFHTGAALHRGREERTALTLALSPKRGNAEAASAHPARSSAFAALAHADVAPEWSARISAPPLHGGEGRGEGGLFILSHDEKMRPFHSNHSGEEGAHGLAAIGDRDGPVGVVVEMALGVDAQRTMDGGVQVGHGDGVLKDGLAQLIGGADGLSGLQSAASQRDAKRLRVMAASAAVVEFGRATKLGGDDDEGLIKELVRFEIGDERGEGLIEIADEEVLILLAFEMRVPDSGAINCASRFSHLEQIAYFPVSNRFAPEQTRLQCDFKGVAPEHTSLAKVFRPIARLVLGQQSALSIRSLRMGPAPGP